MKPTHRLTGWLLDPICVKNHHNPADGVSGTGAVKYAITYRQLWGLSRKNHCPVAP